MIRLFLFLWLLAFVLFLNWLVDWAPTDPPASASNTAARQAILETPVRLKLEGQTLGEELDRLAREHELPFAGSRSTVDSWREAKLDVQPWDQPLRLEDALRLLQWASEYAFVWEWQGQKLVFDRPRPGRPNLDELIGSLIQTRSLPTPDWSQRRLRDVARPLHRNQQNHLELDSRWSGRVMERLEDRATVEPCQAVSAAAETVQAAIEGKLRRESEWEPGQKQLDEFLLQVQRQIGVNFVVQAATLEPDSIRETVVSWPGGRRTVEDVLRSALGPLGLSLRVHQGVVFVATKELCSHVRVYPLWPALERAQGLGASREQALDEIKTLLRWQFPGQVFVATPNNSLVISANRDEHQAIRSMLTALDQSQTPQGSVVAPVFHPQVSHALGVTAPLAREPARLPMFAQNLARQLGIEVRVDPQLPEFHEPLAGDGQGGSIAQQLDRLLAARGLECIEAGDGLEITSRYRATWKKELRFYPLDDLSGSAHDREQDEAPARDRCISNPYPKGAPHADSRNEAIAFLQTILVPHQPRPPLKAPSKAIQIRTGPAQPVAECLPMVGRLAVYAPQRIHRALAAGLDREEPFAEGLSGQSAELLGRQPCLRAALKSRNPLAGAWAVWNLTPEDAFELRAELLAAFTSGALHRDPQPRQGDCCTGAMAFEMLYRFSGMSQAELAAALEKMSSEAGPTRYAESTLKLAYDMPSTELRRAALRGLVHQEGSASLEFLFTHPRITLGGIDGIPAREAACDAFAARWLANLAATLQVGDLGAAERQLVSLMKLTKHRPSLLDAIKFQLRGARAAPSGEGTNSVALFAPLYLELLRDSDPAVRRLACESVSLYPTHVEIERALKTLLGDPLVKDAAQKCLDDH